MPLAADTSPDANAIQIEAYRRMGGTGRAQVMFRLAERARQTTAAGIRSRHPDYDDEQVLLAWARLLYGDELVQRAWPDRELVEP